MMKSGKVGETKTVKQPQDTEDITTEKMCKVQRAQLGSKEATFWYAPLPTCALMLRL